MYALALRQPRAAAQTDPGNGFYLKTLGVAHYRVGRYAKALEALTQSDKLSARRGGPFPATLAFLAMAHHQLGHKEQAQMMFGRLRETMRQPWWANDPERHGFVREVEELLQGKESSPKK